HLPPARLAVLPPALLGRAVPDRVRPRGSGDPDRAAGLDAAGGPAGGRGLLSEDLRPDGRGHPAADPAVAGWRLGRGRAGPRRGPQDLPARDEHDAAVGRFVLVPPALHRPDRGRRPGPSREREVLARRTRG